MTTEPIYTLEPMFKDKPPSSAALVATRAIGRMFRLANLRGYKDTCPHFRNGMRCILPAGHPTADAHDHKYL